MPYDWKNFQDRTLLTNELKNAIDGIWDNATPSAVGQLYLLASSAAFPDLDSTTWVPITQYDATVPANAAEAKGVTLDPVSGTMAFKVPGLWRLDFTFSMTHNESNQGRTLELRTFNTTDSIPGDVVSVAIGRNQPGTSYAINTLLDISETQINKPIRIEAKMATGSAAMTGITFTELGFIGTYNDSFSQLQGDLSVIESEAQSRFVEAAYGGMRFQSPEAVLSTIGTTPTKITLYNEQMPLFGPPLHMAFDQANSEVVIETGQGGVYEVSLFLNFQGEQGEVYTVEVRLDTGSGPQPVGNPILVRVSQADPYAELQLSTIGRIGGGGRWSVWVYADKNNTDFNVFGTSLYFIRISGREPGIPTAQRGLFFGGGGRVPDNGDDDDDDQDDD